MNKKAILITAIILIPIIILLFVFMNKPISDNNIQNNYIIEKINNKETFNLLISTDSNFIKAMNYYKKTYSISYEYIEKENVEFYNLLNKRTGFHISPQDENVFMIFKDGDAVSSYTGPYLESSIRKLLIDNNVLDEKYKEIDYVIYDNEFDEYFKKDTLFNILYINESSDDLYKYREILMKNNVKSLVLYANNIDSSNTCILFDEMFNINSDSYNNFPLLIKVKSGKTLSIEKNITLNNFMDKLSK